LELVPGGPLSARLDGRPWPPRRAAALVEALARAVHYAHSRGIVHRDLKPGNVLLAEDGTPKVTDFGLAKFTESDDRPTQIGEVLGTPDYMAPEQAAGGRYGAIGPAADVWALGAILYECLTGQAPFSGEDPVEIVLKVRTEEPPAPASLNPAVPRDLETVCLKCLEKEPERRYGSAEALADDLRNFLEGLPVRAGAVGLAGRAWKWALRHPALASVSAGLVLTSALGVAALAWGLVRAVEAREEADRRTAVERQAKEQVEAAEGQTRQALGQREQSLYLSRVARAHLSWRLGDWADSGLALGPCAPGPGAADLRGWEWHYLKGRNNPEIALLGLGLGGLAYQGLAFAPNGRLLAAVGIPEGTYGRDSGRTPGAALIWDLPGTRPRVIP